MAQPRKNTFNRHVIDAILCTPFIVLGPTKKHRRNAVKKWGRVLSDVSRL